MAGGGADGVSSEGDGRPWLAGPQLEGSVAGRGAWW